MPLLQLLPFSAVLTTAAVVSVPAQDALDISTFPVQHLPRYQEESALTLAVSAPGGGPYLTFPIVPFTQEAGLNVSQSQRGVRLIIWIRSVRLECVSLVLTTFL